ncbi:S8 family serine peptidase [Chloroflexota bacterium]
MIRGKMRLIAVAALALILAFMLGGGAVAAKPEAKIDVLIGFAQTPGTTGKALVRGYGGKIKHAYHVVPVIAASVSETAIAKLRANPNVAYVEEDGRVYAIQETLPWGVDRIDGELVHPYNKGTGVKVAVIDTGIDYTHPDLDANYKGGYDYVDNDADPLDDNGHGTHCAGIIAGEDNDEGVIGVAPEAWLYAVKVLDATGSGYTSDVVAGIQWSVDNGMQAISMSLSTGTDSDALHAACDAAYEAEIVVVAAAGNDYRRRGRTEFDTVDYPARYDSVIAVGATDETDTKASFSSTGLALELAAPGVSIYSTMPTYEVTLSASYGYNYGTLSGTSMACPHAAGAAALVIVSEPTLTNAEVRQRLQATADDLGNPGWDKWYGYGLVDADEAAPLPDVPNTLPVADADGPYSGTEDVAITFDGLGSYDSDGDPLTYAWDFGDGSTGTGANPSYAYIAGGTYTVTLVVNDGKADSEPSTTTADIIEVNDSPVAEAGSDQTAVVGAVVTFDGSSSYDIDGTIVAYDWDFGDENTGTSETATHAYVTAGTYTVILVVTDDGGLTDADEATVTVTEVPAYPTMNVASIEMLLRTRGRNVNTVATVTIVNADGNPVEGATVYGQWSGLTSDSDSGVTDASGKVALSSDTVRNSGTFTFTVTDVTKGEWMYDSDANVETSDWINYP